MALTGALQQGTTARNVWVHLKHREVFVMGQGGLCGDGCGFLHFIFIIYKSLKKYESVQCKHAIHGDMGP